MYFICKAPFVACSLLSAFDTITEMEREAVRYVLELIPCYDGMTGRLRMTHDAHVLAQIYLAELRILAARHSYVHEGSLEDATQARALLSVIVLPLVNHISDEEYECLLGSMGEADILLSYSTDVLIDLITMWHARYYTLMLGWRSFPITGVEQYEFGTAVPGGFRLEDILTPLPYPRIESMLIPDLLLEEEEHVSEDDQKPKSESSRKHRKLTKRRSNDSRSTSSTRSRPRSECGKELLLLSSKSNKSKSKSFFLSDLFTRRSSDRDMESDSSSIKDEWRSDSYFDIDDVLEREFWLLENEKKIESGDFDCPCASGHLCYIHADGHPSDYEGDVKAPKRKRIARCLKALLRF